MPDALCAWASARMQNVSWEMCIYHHWERYDQLISKSVARSGTWEPRFAGTMLNTLLAHHAQRPLLHLRHELRVVQRWLPVQLVPLVPQLSLA